MSNKTFVNELNKLLAVFRQGTICPRFTVRGYSMVYPYIVGIEHPASSDTSL